MWYAGSMSTPYCLSDPPVGEKEPATDQKESTVPACEDGPYIRQRIEEIRQQESPPEPAVSLIPATIYSLAPEPDIRHAWTGHYDEAGARELQKKLDDMVNSGAIIPIVDPAW